VADEQISVNTNSTAQISFTLNATAVKGNSNGIEVESGIQSTVNVIPISDPLFSVNAFDDYDLSNNSPCLAKATITTLTEDIRGIRRPPFPKGTYPDLGAYENLSNDNSTGAFNTRLKVIYPTINGAVSGATPFDTIIVLEGTHTETINLNKSLTIGSSYLVNGDGLSADRTILDGQGTHRIMTCDFPGDNTYQIIGLTLKNGSTDYMGGAIYAKSQKSLFVQKCIFDNNKAVQASGIFSGNTEKGWIEDCIFRTNRAQSRGVIYVEDRDH
jgi:hypothetical protein